MFPLQRKYSFILLTRECGLEGLGTAVLRFVAVNTEEPCCWVKSNATSSLSRFPIQYMAETSGGMRLRRIRSEQEAG